MKTQREKLLEKALRERFVQLSCVITKWHTAHFDTVGSLCGLCSARGEEDVEPEHRDSCPLYEAAPPKREESWISKQSWADQFALWWSYVSLHLHSVHHESCKLTTVEIDATENAWVTDATTGVKTFQAKPIKRRIVVNVCVPRTVQ